MTTIDQTEQQLLVNQQQNRQASDMPISMDRRVQARKHFSQTRTSGKTASKTTLASMLPEFKFDGKSNAEFLNTQTNMKDKEGESRNRLKTVTAANAPMISTNQFMLSQNSSAALRSPNAFSSLKTRFEVQLKRDLRNQSAEEEFGINMNHKKKRQGRNRKTFTSMGKQSAGEAHASNSNAGLGQYGQYFNVQPKTTTMRLRSAVQSKRLMRNLRNVKTTDQQMRTSAQDNLPKMLDIEIESGEIENAVTQKSGQQLHGTNLPDQNMPYKGLLSQDQSVKFIPETTIHEGPTPQPRIKSAAKTRSLRVSRDFTKQGKKSQTKAQINKGKTQADIKLYQTYNVEDPLKVINRTPQSQNGMFSQTLTAHTASSRAQHAAVRTRKISITNHLNQRPVTAKNTFQKLRIDSQNLEPDRSNSKGSKGQFQTIQNYQQRKSALDVRVSKNNSIKSGISNDSNQVKMPRNMTQNTRPISPMRETKETIVSESRNQETFQSPISINSPSLLSDSDLSPSPAQKDEDFYGVTFKGGARIRPKMQAKAKLLRKQNKLKNCNEEVTDKIGAVCSAYKKSPSPRKRGDMKQADNYKAKIMERIRNTSPKKMIEDLKADLRAVTKDNENNVSNIAKLYVWTKELKKDTVELNEKVTKAQQDKKELLRDLSTYELSFGRQQCNRVPVKIQNIKEQIQFVDQAIKRSRKADSKAEQDKKIFVNEQKQTELLDLMLELPESKNFIRKSKQGEYIDVKPRAPKKINHSFDPDGTKKQMMAKFNAMLARRSGKVAADTGYYYNRKTLSSFRGVIKISGIQCMIKADQMNGKIDGHLSCKRSNKPFKFNFRPIQYRRENNIQAELSRLYFDVTQEENHSPYQNKVITKTNLCLLREEEYLADLGLDCFEFQRDPLNAQKWIDTELVNLEEPGSDRFFYFLANIIGMKKKAISLRLVRDGKFVILSCKVENEPVELVLDWDTINLHIEKHDSDVQIAATPMKSDQSHSHGSKRVMLVNDSDSEVDVQKKTVNSNGKDTAKSLKSEQDEDKQSASSRINNLWSAPAPYRRVSLLRIAQFYQSKLAINQIEDGSYQLSFIQDAVCQAIDIQEENEDKNRRLEEKLENLQRKLREEKVQNQADLDEEQLLQVEQALAKEMAHQKTGRATLLTMLEVNGFNLKFNTVLRPVDSRLDHGTLQTVQSFGIIANQVTLSHEQSISLSDHKSAGEALNIQTGPSQLSEIRRSANFSGNMEPVEQVPFLMDDQAIIDFFEFLYLKRLQRSFRRFYNMAVDQKRLRLYNQINHNERTQVLAQYIEVFNQDVKVEIKPPARQDELAVRKRPMSMFKLGQIQNANMVISLYDWSAFKSKSIPDGDYLKLMSYSINGTDIFMAVGIEKREKVNISTQKSDSSIKGSAREVKTVQNPDKEKQTDSIYFIEFKIDQVFLNFLNDPSIDTIERCAQNISYIVQNRTFIQLIREELKMRRLSRVQAYQKKQTELLNEQTGKARKRRIQEQSLMIDGQNKLQGGEYMRLDVPVIVEDTSSEESGKGHQTPHTGRTLISLKTPLPRSDPLTPSHHISEISQDGPEDKMLIYDQLRRQQSIELVDLKLLGSGIKKESDIIKHSATNKENRFFMSFSQVLNCI